MLTRPLAAGDVVKASDLTIVRRPKAEAGANVVTDAAQAMGLAARRAMRPGQIMRQTDLMKPEVVARNENVTITYEVPGIVLTMRGKALETGAQGDVINVLNVASNKAIQATVAGPGHVIVSSRARHRRNAAGRARARVAVERARSVPSSTRMRVPRRVSVMRRVMNSIGDMSRLKRAHSPRRRCWLPLPAGRGVG